MKRLEIPRVADVELSLEHAGCRLANEPQHAVDTLNWAEFPYRPRVSFAIAYGGGDLYVRFAVEEDAVLAEKTEANAAVSQDSCVEVFIAPHSDLYFSFEFNCIGTVLVTRGHGREDLECLDPEVFRGIRRESSLGAEPFSERQGDTSWQLTVAIPLAILGLNEVDLPGYSCRANFYKCGDNLSKPHYVSWSPINAPTPDFHRPECFGAVRFV